MEPASKQKSLGEFIAVESEQSDNICPTCGKKCKSELGVKMHHARSHDTSLAKSTHVCEWCSAEFEKYDCWMSSGVTFCSEECLNDYRKESDFNEGSKNGRHKGDAGQANCEWCGKSFRRRPSELRYYERSFCSTECRGEWFSENIRGDDHWAWKGGNGGNYGARWQEQREKAIERDNKQCVFCEMSRESHRQHYGVDINVHHIIPRKSFDDEEKADSIENLITLCKSCHSSVEHISQQKVEGK